MLYLVPSPIGNLQDISFRALDVLKKADLVHAEKAGKSVLYHLKRSVLEDALLGFVLSFGLGDEAPAPDQEIAR